MAALRDVSMVHSPLPIRPYYLPPVQVGCWPVSGGAEKTTVTGLKLHQNLYYDKHFFVSFIINNQLYVNHEAVLYRYASMYISATQTESCVFLLFLRDLATLAENS